MGRSRPGGLPAGVLRTTTAAWWRLGSLRASMPPKWQHLPNALSLFRLIAGPAMVAAHWETRPGIAFCAMFVLGGLSDGADGYLARKLDVCSVFGAELDNPTSQTRMMSRIVLARHAVCQARVFMIFSIIKETHHTSHPN